MLIAMLAVIGLTAIAGITIMGRRDGSLAAATPTHVRTNSPVDEAERILAHRYAKGEVTAEEYGRMLTILRR